MSQFAQQPLNAELKFLADLSAPLVYVPSKGGGDQTEHLGNYRTHAVEIHNAREQLPATDLDREGFKLLSHDSAVSDFYDDAALSSTYHPELIELIKRATGARRVEIFDDTRRSSSSAKQREHGTRDPANIVHNDYTHESGPRRLEDFFSDSPDQVPRLKQRRFAIINAWRPIGEPVVDHPLVLCDARSVRGDDLVAVERRGADRIGELQVAMYQPDQRWYYYPRMHRGEVLLFKTYDSALDGRTRFTPHSSCKDPRAPADAAPRESLETRCMVFF
ncbi:CmcJ/NvfI family oxidoreductase [Wenzhouxiangella limi]|uniref:CmcJ/NvfI family oxidoreductase n=1 Tax=Wenzhouxiangella limi TaxID=2707351 RepID=UPI001940831A|nr:CmcJ/NvfI family oxidoreductase [Wenzhouxiangella limi]